MRGGFDTTNPVLVDQLSKDLSAVTTCVERKSIFDNWNNELVDVEKPDSISPAVKEAIEERIEKGYSDIDIIDSQNAIFNFKINENVPSSILENARSATKEIVLAKPLGINSISINLQILI